jgi:hypothetical protein
MFLLPWKISGNNLNINFHQWSVGQWTAGVDSVQHQKM